MNDRPRRFVSQFAALQKESAVGSRSRWLRVGMVMLLAAAAALALYDMLR
jgi:hypothetical protein